MPRRLLWLLPLAFALALLAWWGLQHWQGPRVSAYRVHAQPLVQDVVATGRVITPSRVNVASEVTGTVLQRLVERGQHVEPGQLLLRLRSDQAQAQLEQARAALRQLLQQTRPQALAALRSADSALRLAQAQARRARAQAPSGALSQQALEQAEQAEQAAQQQQAAARAAWDAARPGGAVQLQLQAAQAAAQAVARRSEIRAEVAGQVLTRNVEVGDTITPGQVLFTLARAGDTEVSLPVDEQNLHDLAVGQQARCITDGYPDRVLDASLVFIAPAVDTSSGTIELRLRVSDPPAWLRQDMTISCDLRTAQLRDALVVPDDALREPEGRQARVLVLRGGEARAQEVRLGLRGLVASQVVQGLRNGDVVIADRSVRAGQRVRARLQGLPAAPASAAATGAATGGSR
ncbi:efflux RND transporter periplasmic adaptor subunit [Thiomonas sp.]|uniref:efflux RND transporter periplasmic adaptor subunit n=1 Tax=Thiomonas sp. TaxID=2047785 RepID=UPI0026262889|nr:efflux RND transporter periplasmic adaptor subunit [Thiomonas sp.]